MFRELAVSYMERFDLAHVDPSGEGFDALGKGVEEGKPAPETRYVSKGLTRSRTDRLKVMQGGAQRLPPQGQVDGRSGRGGASNVTALASAARAPKSPAPPRSKPSRSRNSRRRRRWS